MSTTTTRQTATTMSVSADPSIQNLDDGRKATEGNFLVDGIPQDPAKARRKAKPKTAAAPTGAVAESGKKSINEIETLLLLSNAQRDCIRASSLLQSKHNPNMLKHFGFQNCANIDAEIKKLTQSAIKNLKGVLHE